MGADALRDSLGTCLKTVVLIQGGETWSCRSIERDVRLVESELGRDEMMQDRLSFNRVVVVVRLTVLTLIVRE